MIEKEGLEKTKTGGIRLLRLERNKLTLSSSSPLRDVGYFAFPTAPFLLRLNNFFLPKRVYRTSLFLLSERGHPTWMLAARHQLKVRVTFTKVSCQYKLTAVTELTNIRFRMVVTEPKMGRFNIKTSRKNSTSLAVLHNYTEPFLSPAQ